MIIARPINLNVSCKLHLYSLQWTRSPSGPHLPKRIRNMHPCNYYDLKGKDIDVYFSFLSRGIILWIESPWPENPVNIHGSKWFLWMFLHIGPCILTCANFLFNVVNKKNLNLFFELFISLQKKGSFFW